MNPADAYLGDSHKILRETDNPDFPRVVNDDGVFQPMFLRTSMQALVLPQYFQRFTGGPYQSFGDP